MFHVLYKTFKSQLRMYATSSEVSIEWLALHYAAAADKP